MKTLKEIMREGFIFAVQRTAPVSVAARVMETHNVGIVAVVDGDRLVGVFSERDVVRRVLNRGRDPEMTPVEMVMTRDLVVASEDEDYQSAMRKVD
ncbi:MAG: CBS domain-containing protein, partial [Candidatus Rokubacteria bacterium]|nr:CBS domain-containing protein [Candidatus Rokubacteria bacterium]